MVKLKRINNLLLAAILVVNAYIVFAPLLPSLPPHSPASPAHEQALQKKLHPKKLHKPQPNTLTIPVIGLEQPINEGRDLRAATNGPWRLPHSSSPDHGSNTVIVGHRFTYTQPKGTFYNLNKLKPGDEIGVYWSDTLYHYKVKDSRTVTPSRTSVEAPTAHPTLTLYTCTPLWWPKNRLVVTATLEDVQT